MINIFLLNALSCRNALFVKIVSMYKVHIVWCIKSQASLNVYSSPVASFSKQLLQNMFSKAGDWHVLFITWTILLMSLFSTLLNKVPDCPECPTCSSTLVPAALWLKWPSSRLPSRSPLSAQRNFRLTLTLRLNDNISLKCLLSK